MMDERTQARLKEIGCLHHRIDHLEGIKTLLIEQKNTLEAQLAEARKVIEPLAKHAAHYDPDEGDGNHVTWDVPFTVSDLRAARAWMEKNDG